MQTVTIIAIVLAAIGTGLIISDRRRDKYSPWQATVIPLASILGSGFLISAPLLARQLGNNAIFGMVALVAIAYLFGEAIRFNIQYLEPRMEKGDKGLPFTIERISFYVLAAGYVIAVAFYLNLLSGFILEGFFQIDRLLITNIVTSAFIVLIALLGWWKGLDILESVTKNAANLNLILIIGFFIGLLSYNAQAFVEARWVSLTENPQFGWGAMRSLLGLIFITQGFEVSRFLSSKYDYVLRVKTMRYAQLIAGAIYILLIALTTTMFGLPGGQSTMAVLEYSQLVVLVLPFLMVIAAFCSQFSAAVADTVGSGGLMVAITEKQVFVQRPARTDYFIVAGLALILTWLTDVVEIVSIASRVFAVFYSLQCAAALTLAFKTPGVKNRFLNMALFITAIFICLSIVIFAKSAFYN